MIKYINKIALLAFTIFSISCAANNTTKGVKTLTNKRGETFIFHGNGTASVEYDGANLGSYPTNNNNPKESDKVQLYKESDRKCVYVGNLRLLGGMQNLNPIYKYSDFKEFKGSKSVFITKRKYKCKVYKSGLVNIEWEFTGRHETGYKYYTFTLYLGGGTKVLGSLERSFKFPTNKKVLRYGKLRWTDATIKGTTNEYFSQDIINRFDKIGLLIRYDPE